MNKILYCLLLSLILIHFSSCSIDDKSKDVLGNNISTLFSLVDPEKSGVDFSNTIFENEVDNISDYDYYYNGGGVAVGDFNNDGLDDLFFCGNTVNNKLYLNKGNLKFDDISIQSGITSGKWSTGVTLIDINNDGFLDIYICNSKNKSKKARENQLYINNGDLTFTEEAKKYGIANDGFSSQASFFDYDKDGDLDLLVMNHSLLKMKVMGWMDAINNMPVDVLLFYCSNLYQNNGNQKFSNITEKAGLLKAGFGLGLVTSDLNNDGWVDIFVSNDYFMPDYMFINQKDGTFKESIKERTSHISYFSMGADAADFNNDGLLDLGVADMTPGDHEKSKTNMASMNVKLFDVLTEGYKFQNQYMVNALHVNRGRGFFSEIGLVAGVSKTDWSWGTLFADFDNDGLKDYVITNGFKRDTKNNDYKTKQDEIIELNSPDSVRIKLYQHLLNAPSNPVVNFVFKNDGNYHFKDKSHDWGFREPSFSNGIVYSDLDNDGDLDLVINNIDKQAFLYENNATKINKNSYIRFNVLAKDNISPAYNSKVTVYYDENIQYAELHPVRGYLSSVETTLHFGLKDLKEIDSVKIQWIEGYEYILKSPELNKTHEIGLEKAIKKDFRIDSKQPIFTQMPSSFIKIDYKHKEDGYDDFAKEILLPHRQSMLGPFVAVGDVNGDQIEDFFVGGAKGQSGQLYLQNANSGFSLSTNQAWSIDKGSEDMGALFFDADGDKDLDLYVVSGGGGEFEIGSKLLQDRLYINNGKGQFSKKISALPSLLSSGGRVKAIDFDKDGDLDLFIAGRTVPGKYPYTPMSYLLRNNNGKFEDVTKEIAPGLHEVGMVTDAVWTDIDNDGLVDLIVVGEWIPISYFKNVDGKFINFTDKSDFKDKKGWWSSIVAVDFDKDGDMDLIVGNLGDNNKFHPTVDKPLHVFCNDFDHNGSLDIVLSKSYKNNLVPIRGKECSTQQMPFVSEKFQSYKSFAESSLNDIYGEDLLNKALHYSVNTFRSYYIENKGEAGFLFHDLPEEAQFSPINSIIAEDFDKDGHIDLVVAGNSFQTEVETPRYDAGNGLFLKGNGDGTFKTSLNFRKTGMRLSKDVKDLKLINIGKNNLKMIIVANNNDELQFVVSLVK